MLTTGFYDGLIHPVFGIDHLLAMVGVGIISVIFGNRAIWYIPGAFVVAMAVGGWLGLKNVMLPHSEAWIAASLIVLGFAIAIGEKIVTHGNILPLLIVSIFVIVFGIAHGNAHGIEAPQTAEPTAFVLGFLLGTSLLHLAGVATGLLSK
jgi:urease accessory protein